jgi:type I restriction enzyme S subunit
MAEPAWSEMTLAAIGDWRSGGTPSKSRADYWVGTIPWVSPKDMKVFVLRDAQDHISQQAIADGARWVPAGSVFIVVRGMILAHTFPVCVAERMMAFNQDVKALVPNAAADGRFLAHWLVGRSDALLRLVTEATHGTKRIELRDLLAHSIAMPPLVEQRRIAEILDTVDEAIRKTEEIIAKLERVKQGLLHDLLTRGIDANGELRDRARHEFSRREVGIIPTSWRVERVSDAGSVQLGKMRSHRQVAGRETPYLRVANVEDNYINTSDVLSMPFTVDEIEKFRLLPGDILLNEGQSTHLVGRAAMYRGDPPDCAFQKTLLRFRASSLLNPDFALCLFRWYQASGRFGAVAVQTTSMAHLTAVRFERMKVAIPPLPEQLAIVERAKAFERRLEAERHTVNKLQRLKRGLAEDLLTGRVRVTPLLAEAAE